MLSLEEDSWIIDIFPVGPLRCNCTLIGNRLSGEGILVDPGGDFEIIMEKTRAAGLTIKRVFHTHAHFDHFLASEQIRKATGATLHLHEKDLFLWDSLEMQCRMFKIPYTSTARPDAFIRDGEDIHLPGITGNAIHTPGHTPGSISFIFESAKLLIAGDTLFKEGIGRTDLWGGDFSAIKNSITSVLFSLPEEFSVVTGHGPLTTIGHEKRFSPIL